MQGTKKTLGDFGVEEDSPQKEGVTFKGALSPPLN